MNLSQLDHDLVTGFLRYLETGRGNSLRTRNARLAAIHSMFRYAALRAPEDAAEISGSWPSRAARPPAPISVAHRRRSRRAASRLRPRHLDRPP